MRYGDSLDSIYEKDSGNGNYVVEITVETYDDIFKSSGNGILKKKDLNTDVREFIYDCSFDIPFREDIELCFRVRSQEREINREKAIIKGFRNYFSFYMDFYQKLLGRSYSRVVKYIIVSLVLLVSGVLAEENMADGILSSTIAEGLNIGGWVFLWEAITFLLDGRREIIDEMRKFKRFARSPIIFMYKEEGTADTDE
jgi:hypothetical protein